MKNRIKSWTELSRCRLRSAKKLGVAFLAATACIWIACAAEISLPTNGQTTDGNLPAEKSYKNIQVFKGLPASQLMENMFYMEGALGVSCDGCHVNFEDFEKDDNIHKGTARRMIEMVRTLNKDHFAGQSTITCNTCHRGSEVPRAPLSFAAITSTPTKRAETPKRDSPAVTVDQILDRYLVATGSRSASNASGIAILSGSMLSSEGWVAPLRIYVGPPDKFLATFQIEWISYSGYNGAVGWGQDNNGLHDLVGNDLAMLRRKAAVYLPSTLKQLYSSLTIKNNELVGEREVYVLEGVKPDSDIDRLYFDVASGLLVRIQSDKVTSLGVISHRIEVKDYRDISGVKLPFELDDFAADFSSEYKIVSAIFGMAAPAGLFEKPQQPLKSSPK